MNVGLLNDTYCIAKPLPNFLIELVNPVKLGYIITVLASVLYEQICLKIYLIYLEYLINLFQ